MGDRRKALIVGATGLVGKSALDALLAADIFDAVVALQRRPSGRTHAKLGEVIVDFDALTREDESSEEIAQAFAGITDVFACLGTTIKAAGSQERFRKVDHDYTLAVARRARAAGATRLALVSSVGADASARTFYTRVKGETENALAALGWERFVIARPSLLLGERAEARTGEAIATAVMPLFTWALAGGLAKYKPIEGRAVGRAIVMSLAKERIVEGVAFRRSSAPSEEEDKDERFDARVLEYDALLALASNRR